MEEKITIFVESASSPGCGPRGQGPNKNRQGPDKKITGLIMFHLGCQIKNLVFWVIFILLVLKKSIEKDQMATH